MIDPRDGRKEHLPDRFPVENRVISSEIVHQEPLHSFPAIPFWEILQIVLDRMESPLIGHCCQRHLEELLWKLHSMIVGYPHIELLCVGILPEYKVTLPWKGIGLCLQHSGHGIEPDLLQMLIIQKDHKCILRIRHDASILADLQLCAPILVILLGLIQLCSKVADSIRSSCLSQGDLHILIAGGKIHHGLVAWHLCDAFGRISIFIQVAKLVNPHQIESIGKLSSCRIR